MYPATCNINRETKMILPIYIYGHPVLKKKAEDITKDYPNLVKLISDMRATMEKADGVGLAAPQVGLSVRLVLVDAEPMADEDDDTENLKEFKRVFINLKIVEEEGEEWLYKEGCLSVPTIREEIKRKSRIHIQYFNQDWIFQDEWMDGIKARIVQHEHDHLEGIVIPDRISSLRKRLLKGKLTNITQGKFDAKYKIKINN